MKYMIILSYDISNDKTRARFSKFIQKYGRRLQYSVYEIKNSKRVLNNIIYEIDFKFKKEFEDTDSVLILDMCALCDRKIKRYGFAVHEEKDLVFFN